MLIRKVKVLGVILGHALVLGCLVALPVVSAQAGAHTWDVKEIFSDATGNVQFVELFEVQLSGGMEFAPGSRPLLTNAKGITPSMGGRTVAFPTAQKHWLIGSPDFATLYNALPGSTGVDATMPAGVLPFFFAAAGDSVYYSPYDTLTYGPGDLPNDGFTSLNVNISTGVQSTGTNSPTNSLGFEGSVNVSAGSSAIPVLSEWGLILFALLLLAVVARYGIGRPATS